MEKSKRLPSRLGIVAVVTLILLAANILLTFVNTRQLYADANWVEHTHRTINGLEEILSLAKDAETGARGFIITSNEDYLAPYNEAKAVIDAKVADVDRLTSDDPIQRERFSELQRRLNERLKILDGIVTLRKAEGLTAARDSIMSNRSKVVMDSLRELNSEMIRHEQSLLVEREKKSERTFWMVVSTGLLSGLTALVAILVGFWLVRLHNNAQRKAEEVIAEQGERLRITLASIGDAVISTDSDGRVNYLNSVAESLTGWTLEDAQGRQLETVFNIVNESTREKVENPAVKALRDGVIVGLANHTLLIGKDGTEWPIDDSAAPIRDEKGTVSGVVLIFRDITERKLAESQLQRAYSDLERKVADRTHEISHTNRFLNALLENVQEGIVACDSDGVLTLFNRATRELHGLPEESMPAEQWAEHYDLFHPDGATRMNTEEIPLFRALAGEQVKAAEMVIAPKNGEPRYLLASGQQFLDDDGNVLGAVVSMHDITRRKSAEEDLRTAYDDLEIRVAERTAELAASEERATNIVSSIADGLITVDKEWRVTFMNPRGEEIARPLQKTDLNVRGQIFWDEFPATVGTDIEKNFRKAMDEKTPAHFENFYPPLSSWFDVRVYPSRDGLSIYFLDITRRKEAEQQTLSSESRFRAAVGAVSSLIWTNNAQGEMEGVQPGWEGFTGQTFEEYQGYGWATSVHPDDSQPTLDAWNGAVAEKKTFVFEHRLRRADGEWRLCSVRAVPVIGAENEIREWVGVHTDITEQNEAEANLRDSEARKSAMFEAALDCIISMDHEGRIIEFNASAEKTFGHRHEKVIGRDLADVIIPPAYREGHRKGMEHYFKTGEGSALNRRLELSALRADGSEFPVELTVTRIPVDGPAQFTAYLRDITESKQLMELQEKATLELRQIAAKLSEADRRKNEFLAMLAHELRNPLAPIRNALHIMRMTSDGDGPIRSASEMMERQVGQLVRLVDDLLDVSRITRGKIELRLEKVEVASIIYQAVEAAQPSCHSGGVILDVELPDMPIYLNGDSARINQAIGNLLNNSCKFTDEGGRIHLSLTEEAGFAKIRVKDTGIGIAEEQLPIIFDLFVQADTSLERAVSGLGIGLTLVKNLVEMHGGTISGYSEGLGKGSEFTIRIPILEPEAAVKDQTDLAQREFSKIGPLRILVVDDNVDSAESLALLLEFSGHVAAMAHDGRAAVDMASSFDPEVILLDIGLPRLNGYEAARLIRQLPKGKEINLIALTGWGQQEDRERSKEAGFDGHMVKPVDHVELMEWLEKISKAKNGSGH